MLLAEFSNIATFLATEGTSIKNYFAADLPWCQSIILSGFAGLNTVRVLAYVPQIIKAAKDNHGASAISYTTWALFFFSHLTTIAYAIICLGDLLMGLIFFANAIACLAIVLVTFLKRQSFRRNATQQQHGESPA